MNLREQFNTDTKGHAHFNAYCRAEVDKKPSSMAQAHELCAEVRDAVKAHEELLRLYDMFDKYPMGCKRIGAEWARLWNELKRYLESWARVEYQDIFDTSLWHHKTTGRAHECLIKAAPWVGLGRRRVKLLDGTIVREWPAI
jgi:hypothetical protein